MFSLKKKKAITFCIWLHFTSSLYLHLTFDNPVQDTLPKWFSTRTSYSYVKNNDTRWVWEFFWRKEKIKFASFKQIYFSPLQLEGCSPVLLYDVARFLHTLKIKDLRFVSDYVFVQRCHLYEVARFCGENIKIKTKLPKKCPRVKARIF